MSDPFGSHSRQPIQRRCVASGKKSHWSSLFRVALICMGILAFASSGAVHAQVLDDAGGTTNAAPGNMDILIQHLLAAIVFSAVGVIVFFASLWLMEKLTPFSIIQEVTEEQNMALALIVGMIVLGIAVIIAAAILG